MYMMIHLIRILKVFLLLASMDAVWLVSMGQRLYRHYLGYLFADTFQYSWAILFYGLYAAAVTHFVVEPYLRQTDVSIAVLFAEGFFFGLVAYSAYDLTNQATIKNWPLIITVVDMLWGATLTGTVAVLAHKLLK